MAKSLSGFAEVVIEKMNVWLRLLPNGRRPYGYACPYGRLWNLAFYDGQLSLFFYDFLAVADV